MSGPGDDGCVNSSNRKKKRVSKNKKKSWRKHTDINDIEDCLDDKRFQERTGGIVAEKQDAELFFIDKAVTENTDSTDRASEGRGRCALRCHTILQPDPNIKPARIRHNVKKFNLKHSCEDKRIKIENNVVTNKDKSAVVHRKAAIKSSKRRDRMKNTRNAASYDLWGDSFDTQKDDSHYQVVTKLRRVNAPSRYHDKPSGIQAVEPPHAGASYNPSLEAYSALMQTAHHVEVVKQRQEEKLTRALDDMFPDKRHAPTQESYLEEMSAGLFKDNEEGETPNDPPSLDEDRISINPPVRREDKKTVTQRNKAKRQKEEIQKAKALRLAKLKAHQNKLGIRALKRRVAAGEREREARLAHRALLKEKFKDKPKKLGSLKFEQPDLEVKLVDELQGTLRQLKPEGHLLHDRFKSLQQRNIIEPRKYAKHKKTFRPKVFEKKSHKEIAG